MSSVEIGFRPVQLSTPSGALSTEVLPRGLTVHRLLVKLGGKTHDLVIGPEDPIGHQKMKYTNPIIGRYTNRVPVGTHTIKRGALTASVTAQPNESDKVSLHGGPDGFDITTWSTLDPAQSTLFTAAELGHLKAPGQYALFTHTSPAGAQGYPGTLRVETLFVLSDGFDKTLGSIAIFYRAKVAEEGVLTPVNLTQHWGFNLDASLGDDPKSLVRDHTMNLRASHIVDLDNSALATGKVIPTSEAKGHTLDGKKLGDDTPEGGGYDHFYILSQRKAQPPYYATRISTADKELDVVGAVLSTSVPANDVCTLTGARSGIAIGFDTNQSGVQFYSNNFANGDGAKKVAHGGSGKDGKGEGYLPFTAAFLEFHAPIATFLHPSLWEHAGGDDTLLASGEVYSNWVRADVRQV